MNKELDRKLINLFKVQSITHIVGHTSLGSIAIQLNKDEDNYVVLLDSVRVDKNTNKEVLELLNEKSN